MPGSHTRVPVLSYLTHLCQEPSSRKMGLRSSCSRTSALWYPSWLPKKNSHYFWNSLRSSAILLKACVLFLSTWKVKRGSQPHLEEPTTDIHHDGWGGKERGREEGGTVPRGLASRSSVIEESPFSPPSTLFIQNQALSEPTARGSCQAIQGARCRVEADPLEDHLGLSLSF